MKNGNGIALVIGCLLIALLATQAKADLVAYYTLDNLSTGVQNLGTNGSLSNLTVNGTIPLTTGIIGTGAVSFSGAGGNYLSNRTAGNAADALSNYPFTLSVWVRNGIVDSSRDAIFGMSRFSTADSYYHIGLGTNDAGAEAELIIRNTAFIELNAASSDVTGTTWHQVTAVYSPGNVQQIYYDGKLAGTLNNNQTFSDLVDTITIGGFLRNSGTSTTDALKGDVDDAGIFNTSLSASDIALIHGLGRVGGIGLDQLDEAAALAGSSIGTTATIGGSSWQRVSGLSGTTGDYGGTVAGNNAYIVLDGSGNGIASVPEPATFTMLAMGLASGLLLLRAKRRN